MISRLHISNYALIRDLELCPDARFNIITGETGAGKSIIMGALSLLQGRRADTRAAGNPHEKSVVEATFTLSDNIISDISAILADAGLDIVPGHEMTLRREILPSGRSRASIDGTQVQLSVLGAVADTLVDIHSQHKNLLLADSDFQRDVLDALADNRQLLAEYHRIYADYRVALQNFARTRDEIERTGADADYLEYQLGELEKLQLRAGEEEELEQQRELLANSTAISEHLSAAAETLSWGNINVAELLSTALSATRSASELTDEFTEVYERLQNAADEIDAVAAVIADRAATMHDDPAALYEIENRLSRIESLKTKHRVATLDELIELRDSIAARLAALNDGDATLKDLEYKARALKKAALEKATVLSTRRKEAAAFLSKALTERARPLGMENLRADVRVTTGKLNPDGVDTVEFLFSFNKNQEPAPVGSRASGGEISRVMLALKSITSGHRHLPTIIFDEIDTGVSGDVANRMGALMSGIGDHLQVLTVTHLPQVAARGDSHFKVFKTDDDTSTSTHITKLTPEGRRAEIALMLSGLPDDPAALAAAEALLKAH